MSFFTKLTQLVTSKTSTSSSTTSTLSSTVAKVVSSSSSSSTSSSSSPQSKKIARERLSVILASQRGSELISSINMDLLQKDVLEVVQRHLKVVENSPVNCNVKHDGDVNLFEMSVEIDSFSSTNTNRHNNNGGGATGGGGVVGMRGIRPARITLLRLGLPYRLHR